MTSFALQLAQKQHLIEDWFSEQWRHYPPPFYTSVDLRESEFKLAPVDTNLFPAGFNNLAPENKISASERVKKTLAQVASNGQRIRLLSKPEFCSDSRRLTDEERSLLGVNEYHRQSNNKEAELKALFRKKSILLIPENHTHNLFYLDNLISLQTLLKHAGFEVRIGSLEGGPSGIFYTASNVPIQFEQVTRTGNQLHIGAFNPDFILLNNDLATGIPPQLEGLNTIPPLHVGWHQRLKSNHFHHYARICEEFSTQFHLESWCFNPLFRYCEHVNFTTREGFSCLRTHTEDLLNAIQKEYSARQLIHTPYVVIKADSGSYGMGIMTIDNVAELDQLSRKKRQHMAKTKGNRAIQKVILQEGIPTITQFEQAVAEPVIYLIGSEVIGGFYRTHATRNPQENLNIPGMQLHPFIFKKLSPSSSADLSANPIAIQHYAYSVIARLATLAAARELEV